MLLRTRSAGRACVHIIAISALAAPAPGATPRFVLTQLEPLRGGEISRALAVNDAGAVVGSSNVPGTAYPHAVAWINGKIIDLTGLGISGASANAIGNDGRIVGFSDALGLNAFQWNSGSLAPLNFPHSCCSEALGINNRGQAVGRASLAGPNTPNDAVLWDGEVIVPLGSIGGTYAHAYDINDAMQIVGVTDSDVDGYVGVLWENGRMSPLPPLGGNSAEALAISPNGQIVGHAENANGITRPARWIDGIAIDLGTLGGFNGAAADVNDAGWIVGWSHTSLPQQQARATLWIDGQIIDLNTRTLMPPGSILGSANGLNSLGQIVGHASIAGASRGYILTPLPAGDVNGDFAINVDDLLAVITAWGPCPPAPASCIADFDGDGAVDVDDLLAVIVNWG
jgi:probable HAF family extracellular repeat protein